MALLIDRVLNVAALLVVVSVTFGAWLQLSPSLLRFSGPVYAEVQQSVLNTLKRFMPFVLLIALVTSVLDVILDSGVGGGEFDFTLAAFVFFLAFLAITVKYELPINAEIEHWTPSTPPADWDVKRQRWERWQTVRAWLSVAALGCLIGSLFVATGHH